MSSREGENRQSFRDVHGHPFGQAGSSLPVLLNRLCQVSLCGVAVQSVEDGADIFSHLTSLVLARQVVQFRGAFNKGIFSKGDI